jgi:hypothetical protein
MAEIRVCLIDQSNDQSIKHGKLELTHGLLITQV